MLNTNSKKAVNFFKNKISIAAFYQITGQNHLLTKPSHHLGVYARLFRILDLFDPIHHDSNRKKRQFNVNSNILSRHLATFAITL